MTTEALDSDETEETVSEDMYCRMQRLVYVLCLHLPAIRIQALVEEVSRMRQDVFEVELGRSPLSEFVTRMGLELSGENARQAAEQERKRARRKKR